MAIHWYLRHLEHISSYETDCIDIGDSLPSITLKNEKGEDVDVSSLASEKGVVLFLVPKADTRKSENTVLTK